MEQRSNDAAAKVVQVRRSMRETWDHKRCSSEGYVQNKLGKVKVNVLGMANRAKQKYAQVKDADIMLRKVERV
eukprot:scaffold1712_cov86-Skeletonema_marinoi.AAC.3